MAVIDTYALVGPLYRRPDGVDFSTGSVSGCLFQNNVISLNDTLDPTRTTKYQIISDAGGVLDLEFVFHHGGQ